MDSLLVGLWIVLMVLGNAVFVAAEFAPIAVPRATIDALASEGNRRARWLRPLLHDAHAMDRYIATVQLGITLITVGLGMYGEHKLATGLQVWLGDAGWISLAASHGIASTVAILTMTYLHVVLGEMVPKSVALASPVRVALWVTPVMLVVRTMLWPLVFITERASGIALRILRVRRDAASAGGYYTSEDLADAVDTSEEFGALTPASGQVLRDLLAFPERTAAEAMVPRVRMIGIPLGASSDDVAAILRRSRHTRHPVYEGDLDHILGAVHVKRLYRENLLGGAPIRSESARPVPFVPETTRLDRVLEVMREHGVHVVIVMDEHGGTAGMLTVEDLFEEVVGEIDEGEDAQPAFTDEPDGGVIVAGTVRLDELGEHMDRDDLGHEEADTVSGLVLLLLGRPARPNDRVEYSGLAFLVQAVANRGVRRCRVERLPPAATGS